MNLRKQTIALDHLSVRKLDAARYHAAKIGYPLNCFATVAPCRGHMPPPESPADYFATARNWIGVWVRRRISEFTAIWTVENNRAGCDPHMHVLLHLPGRFIPAFGDALAQQYPGEDAVHVRRDDGKTYLHSSGYHGSTLNYMRKQMTPQAWWALGKTVRRSKDCGPFVGRRWGTTANVNTTAQNADRRSRISTIQLAA